VTLRKRSSLLGLLVALVLTLPPQFGMAATVSTRSLTARKKSQKVSETPHARKRLTRLSRSRPRTTRVVRTGRTRRHRYHERFTASSFMDDNFEGDATAGEDPIVRQAAIDALGNMNGTCWRSSPPVAAF